jgi:hypothetical protein
VPASRKHIRNGSAPKRERFEHKGAVREGAVQVVYLIRTLTVVFVIATVFMEVIARGGVTRDYGKGSGIEGVESVAWRLLTITWFTLKPCNITPRVYNHKLADRRGTHVTHLYLSKIFSKPCRFGKNLCRHENGLGGSERGGGGHGS